MKHIIDTTKATPILLRPERAMRMTVIQHRPTSWSVFLSGVFGLNRKLAFVDLPKKHEKAFFFGKIAVYYKQETLMINGDKYPVEEWSFWNLCLFCTEGLKFGTFWKFWEWRW